MEAAFENERLNLAITKEKQICVLLENAIEELSANVAELEKKYQAVEDENNEWKVRFDIQTDVNDQLTKQILMLQDKVLAARKQCRDIKRSLRSNTLSTDLGEVSAYMVRMLERERDNLVKQQRDLDWRVDQEAKAYHRAVEEKRARQSELALAAGSISLLKVQTQREIDAVHMSGGFGDGLSTYRSTNAGPVSSYRSPSPSNRNTSMDQQRSRNNNLGPKKRTAAARELPPLDMNSVSEEAD